MGFSTGLYSALSGLRNAQSGLSITGHNVSNSSVTGYTRQQAIQTTSSSINIGTTKIGKNQIGLGSDVAVIRQIRDKFFDASYREQNSIGNYYATKYVAGEEITNIIGELQSSYRAQEVIEDLWQSINDLIVDPAAIETRNNFIQSCVTFLDKMQNISDNLYNYQMNLNGQVMDQVNKINELVAKINEVNTDILTIESDGSSQANDLRDQRNLLIDELSSYIGVEIKEIQVGPSTRIDLLIEGKPLLTNGFQNKIGLKYVNGDYPFVEPVFTNSETILPASADNIKVYDDLQSQDLSVISEKTRGSLKALLICRGDSIANYTTPDSETNNLLIPTLQKKLDQLTNSVVTLLNEAVAPTTEVAEQPYNLHGEQVATQIFVRKTGYDKDVAENPNDPGTLYSIHNIEINPLLIQGDGYNLLAFSATGAQNDTTILEKLSADWKEPIQALDNTSIDNFYQKIIVDFSIEINQAQENYQAQATMVEAIDNKRMSISAVSLDEELSNMLKFQYAYNSSSKIISIIDDMIERIVNI